MVSRRRLFLLALEAMSSKAWIVGPSYDRAFFFASWLAPFALMGVFAVSPLAAFIAFGILDGSHVAATLPLTVFDRTGDRSSRNLYRYGLAVIAALALVVTAIGGVVQLV